jgi:ubiquinone/menaquinone biosynthesis C-methylase UbiE
VSLARYYDKIYHWKNYEKEARTLEKLIRKYKKSSGNLLLDVGCGTGEHIRYFSEMGFESTGVDASKQMISAAKEKKLVATKFFVGNMTDFRIQSEFDAIICLFSSIGYLETRTQIKKAVHNFSKHLKCGGILIIEPWLTKSEYKPENAIHLQVYEDRSLKIARVSSGSMKGNFTVLDDNFLIAEKNRGVSYIRDRNKLRFFDSRELGGILESEGLVFTNVNEQLQSDRELVVAVKRDIC